MARRLRTAVHGGALSVRRRPIVGALAPATFAFACTSAPEGTRWERHFATAPWSDGLRAQADDPWQSVPAITYATLTLAAIPLDEDFAPDT